MWEKNILHSVLVGEGALPKFIKDLALSPKFIQDTNTNTGICFLLPGI